MISSNLLRPTISQFPFKICKFSLTILTLCFYSMGYATVHTKYGVVHAQKLQRGIYVYRNIPYATQPIGEHRFQIMDEPKPWLPGELNQHQLISCPQIRSTLEQSDRIAIKGQEDCLVLDIYRKKLTSYYENVKQNDTVIPVLVYFHPGRFVQGSKNQYIPENLLHFNNIIVVIPNYRLGIIGFFGDKENRLPRNLGLWDQLKSLEWVHDNIHEFGGDPDKITIGGHEAGGASVEFHILSPLSHKYFSAAITASGSAFSPWAINPDPPYQKENVSTLFQCPSTGSLLECAKNLSLRDLLNIQDKFGNAAFVPTFDANANRSLLPFPPEELYKRGFQKNVSYLFGVNENETSDEVLNGFSSAIKTQNLDKIIGYYLQPYILDQSGRDLVAIAAKYHYLRETDIKTYASTKPHLITMLSDFLYNSPMHLSLQYNSRNNSDTYMYTLNNTFVSATDTNDNERIRHISHTEFLFKTSQNIKLHYKDTSAVKKTKENICHIWGHMITNRNLRSYLFWKPFNEHHLNYAEISTSIKNKINYRLFDIEFWSFLAPDLLNFGYISNDHLRNVENSMESNYWGFAAMSLLVCVTCVGLASVALVSAKKFNYSILIPLKHDRDEIKCDSV